MNETQLKELTTLIDLLNAQSSHDCLYTDYFNNADNIRIFERVVPSQNASKNLLVTNKESSELDWWIMYVVFLLRCADTESIYSVLVTLKKLHPDLLYSTEDPRIIKRRLNVLTKWGLLAKVEYIHGTDVDVYSAEEIYKYNALKEYTENAQETQTATLSIDDEYFDEESEDIEYAYYDDEEYNRTLSENKNNSKKVQASCTFNEHYTRYYGEKSKLIICYITTQNAKQFLRCRYGSANINIYSDFRIKLPFEQLGLACVGKVTSALAKTPNFSKFLPTSINSTYNGHFVIPASLEFRKKQQDGNTYTYNCGVFYNYYFPGKGRILPEQQQQNALDMIYQIKNFIGLKCVRGGTDKRDGFVIVCVNDLVDLSKFAHTVKKFSKLLSSAELNRIFFTNDAITSSSAGLQRVIGLKLDENVEEGYELYPIKLPIF